MLVWLPSRPTAVSVHSPLTVSRPRTVSPRSVKKAIAARHGCHPLRGVAIYEDVYKLAYVRGPSGILVMLAEGLKKS